MKTDYSLNHRWIIGLSLVGAANMGLGTLRQLGIIGRLPDPPIKGFDSDAVLLSAPAFALGVPDAPVAMVGLLANVPLALAGGSDRVQRAPWLPVLIASKTIVEVSVAGWYLVQMRTRLHAWCAYCLGSSAILAIIAALSAREASAALRTPRARTAFAAAAVLLGGCAVAVMSALDARRRSGHRKAARIRARMAA
jgi:uncharacterized membrane protein